MKKNLSDEIRELIALARKWLEINLEYCKLTAAEKISILSAAVVGGSICLMLACISLILLSAALVEVFKTVVSAALACVIVAGIYIVLAVVVYFLRNVIFGNIVSRFISKLLLEKKPKI